MEENNHLLEKILKEIKENKENQIVLQEEIKNLKEQVKTDSQKSYSPDNLEDIIAARVHENVSKEEKRKQEIKDELRNEQYISSIKIEEIEDEISKKMVQEILSSDMSVRDKAEKVERITTKSFITNILKKASNTGRFSDNFEFQKLKELEKKGRNLSSEDLNSAKSLIPFLQKNLEKLDKAHLINGIKDEISYENLSPLEKLAVNIEKKSGVSSRYRKEVGIL